jgi:Ca-activated chloride channel family protein
MAGDKLAGAQAAALTFLGLMDLAPARDQVALVRFDTEAELVQPLTHDRAAVEAAIRGLSVREGTYLDRGLAAAQVALAGPGRNPANLPVVVLLTDGQQTGGPQAALDAAAQLRLSGVTLYTIGLGADVDAATLVAMAGGPERYRHAPDAAALADVYAELARDIQCPGLWR